METCGYVEIRAVLELHNSSEGQGGLLLQWPGLSLVLGLVSQSDSHACVYNTFGFSTNMERVVHHNKGPVQSLGTEVCWWLEVMSGDQGTYCQAGPIKGVCCAVAQ